MRRWKVKTAWEDFSYKGLLIVFGVFLAMAFVLFAERSGIRYTVVQPENVYMEEDRVLSGRTVWEKLKPQCLVLMNSEDVASVMAAEEFRQILLDMKVGCEFADVSGESAWAYDPYETVIVLLSDLSPLKEDVLELASWVEQGGDALFAMTLQKEPYLMLIEQKLGIISSGYENVLVESIYPSEDFMAGGGIVYTITEPFESAWAVELGSRTTVHAWSGDGKQIPLIWETEYGVGRFVIDNFGIYEKNMRGFYAASYSLLTDCVIYPVINGAAFYLDDFPSPVPAGDGTYVRRDYGLSIADFYANVWWPDILSLASEYGVRYTGVMIENYEDYTRGEISAAEDSSRFLYFGNMLLRRQGEIGYHGYNHQPLCLDNVEYRGSLPYETWDSMVSMKKAMEELVRFGEELFPGVAKSVYVPPSNVLSQEGREMLAEEFPTVRTVASTYFSDNFAYQQEFEVAEDGIVEQPRIISGCIINDYMKLTAVSELNMHFVSNHFMHPDDLLDPDRGAEMGWESLKDNLQAYMDWLYTEAPVIRNLTGSELSGAVQRFAAVSVEQSVSEDAVLFEVDHFYDEAYFMVRFNDGMPGNVSGGTLTRLTGSLYLLHAHQDTVRVEISR